VKQIATYTDPSEAASRAAEQAGTTLASGLRWYGRTGPACLEGRSLDGRTIRVTSSEPAGAWTAEVL
jgi:hypothetical protein